MFLYLSFEHRSARTEVNRSRIAQLMLVALTSS
jgi:hypothetical protein